MTLEPQGLDLPLERFAKLAFAGDDEARVGNVSNDARRRGDQMTLPLVRREGRDVADERGPVRQPECRVRIHGRLSIDIPEIDPVVHHLDAVPFDAVPFENRRNQLRCGDEDIDVPVLPLGESVTLEMEIDAPRGHNERPLLRPAHLQGHRGQRDRHRIVRMEHRGRQVSQHLDELPRRLDIELAPGRKAEIAQAFAGAAPEFA
jgi:hypothetical protein